MEKLAGQVTRLRKLSLYAQYGDYMKIELDPVKEAKRNLDNLKLWPKIFESDNY